MSNKKTVSLVQGALIAAVYAAATYLSASFGAAYGPVQFRLSEAFTVVSVFSPSAIYGLTLGCILGNLSSPMGIWDIIFGSAATLISALCARKVSGIKFKGIPLLSIIMPAFFNAVIVGAELTFLMPSDSAKATLFGINAAEVFLGEIVVCLAGGIPVYLGLRKSNIFKKSL